MNKQQSVCITEYLQNRFKRRQRIITFLYVSSVKYRKSTGVYIIIIIIIIQLFIDYDLETDDRLVPVNFSLKIAHKRTQLIH